MYLFVICFSLKSTSAVLSEHEEALKRKLNCLLDEARQERLVVILLKSYTMNVVHFFILKDGTEQCSRQV